MGIKLEFDGSRGKGQTELLSQPHCKEAGLPSTEVSKDVWQPIQEMPTTSQGALGLANELQQE